jgi:N-acetylneuraminic acid mutarotase
MWTHPKMSGAAPGPRAAHSCNVVDGRLYIFGGWNGKKALNDLHVCVIDTMTWIPFAAAGAAPTARNNHTSTKVGHKLFVHGGHGGASWLDDLHILDTKTKRWSKPDIPPIIPPARACHTLTKVGTKLYMFGGYDGAKCFNTLEVLDLDTLAWMRPRIAGVWPEARNAHTMTAVGRRLYLFGGHSGNKHLRDMHVLDVERMTWTQPDVKGALPPGLRGHSANLVGKQIFVFGGYDGRLRSNEMYVLDTELPSEERSGPASGGSSSGDGRGGEGPGGPGGVGAGGPPRVAAAGSPRSGAGPTPHDPGRAGGPGGRSGDDAQSLTVRWKQVSSDKMTPVGRQRHTSCVLGTQRLHIFGGFDGHKWLNDLHVLDAGKFEKTILIDRSITELLGNLRQLLNNSDMFSDIVFLVEERPIHAHKAILAVQCPHFNAMFGSGMRESTAEEIAIPGWDYAPFLCMLEFLYTGTIADFSVGMAVELLPLADHYTLDRLRLLCESVLVHNVDAENVCTLFVVAHRSSAAALKKRCLNYILKNFAAVSTGTAFDELSKEPQLLLEVTKASLMMQAGGKHRE